MSPKFWRTYDQQEIDLIEESPDGHTLRAFEFKWIPARKSRIPKLFLQTYPHAWTNTITPDNAASFLLDPAENSPTPS